VPHHNNIPIWGYVKAGRAHDLWPTPNTHGIHATGGAVSWDVPDLKIIAGGDVAVAWGLNRMRVEQSDGSIDELVTRHTGIPEGQRVRG
jgi:hypothetical protein